MCKQCVGKPQREVPGNLRESCSLEGTRRRKSPGTQKVSTTWRSLSDRAVSMGEGHRRPWWCFKEEAGEVNIQTSLSHPSNCLLVFLIGQIKVGTLNQGSLKLSIKISLQGYRAGWRKGWSRFERGIWRARQKIASIISNSFRWAEFIFHHLPHSPPCSIIPHTKAECHLPFIIMLALWCFFIYIFFSCRKEVLICV